ncbi:MAG TPA: DNA starvation/stationary phase protection protein Dps [Thermomicrobiales bacterium]
MAATKTRPTTFPTSIDLPTETRTKMIELCNQQLADSFDLYSQTKQAHWNVKGKDFYQLHLLFDSLAAEVLEHVDLIAERATALGGFATGTARMAAANSTLPEYPTDAVDGPEHVRALVERYAAYAASTRRAIDTATEAEDQSTADMFTEVSRETDKSLWFLEAHLQA